MTTPVTKPGKAFRKPWHLHGREQEIAYYRDFNALSWEEIGRLVGCSGEGARLAYRRLQESKRAA